MHKSFPFIFRFFSSNIIRIILLSSLLNTAFAETSQVNPSMTLPNNKLGESYFQQGDYESSINQWKTLEKILSKQAGSTKHLSILIKLANAYHALGNYPQSIEILNRANELIKKQDNLRQQIIITNSLGSNYLMAGNVQKANVLFQQSVSVARKSNETNLLIASLINLGNANATNGDVNLALSTFSESTVLANVTKNTNLAAKSTVNAALTAFKNENNNKLGKRLLTAKSYVEKTKDTHTKAFHWISLGKIAQEMAEKTDQAQWHSFAYHSFKQAEFIGEKISDPRSISYAKGYLGKLYYHEGRLGEALQLTRQAIFAVEKISAPEILYRWQWQTGKIFKAKGNIKLAISAYQQSISNLHTIRQQLLNRQSQQGSFQEKVGSVYLELANLLFLANDNLQEGEQYQQNLIEARNVIEQLKAAELQDYFKDDCVSALQQKSKSLDTLDKGTAVIYPILFTNRLEVLLSVPNGLKRFTVPVNREDIINEVRLFRQRLENRTTREYLPHAQKLYQWLIAPIKSTLIEHQINTLVIVPDEFLRNIPMAALHNGDNFLIEQYAIANTPGLNIMDSKKITADNVQLLAIGLAESVQGFPALPHVATELKNIHTIFGGEVLQDEDFLLNKVQNELKKTSYNIVHIASHGQFKSDAKKNFILTFDDKLNMDGLEQLIGLSRFRNSPIELLTLSACQTAAGDHRAALGLAGIAIKAGARSAIATLWFINDQAASILVTELYRQLKENNVSKAQAIKNAQLHLINNTPYQHPYFWSPFLLIGNWL